MSFKNDKLGHHHVIVGANALMAAGVIESGFENVGMVYVNNFSGSGNSSISRVYFGETTPGTDYDSVAKIGDIYDHLTYTSGVISSVIRYEYTATGWQLVVADRAISIYGEGGTYKASYTTLALAVAALTAGDILKLKAGTYEADEIDITEPGWCRIIGEPGTIIEGASGADYCLRTVFGAISSTKGIAIENLGFDHGDDATQVGFDCANASATGRINLTMRNCSFESDGGDSLYTLHAGSAGIRWFISDCDFEGPVEFTVKHTDDQLKLISCDCVGGVVTSSDAVVMLILLERVKILHEGLTGGASEQTLYAMYCMSETDANPNVYAEFDTSDAAGSHSNTVIFPTS